MDRPMATPAFANANSGITTNAEKLWSAVSSLRIGAVTPSLACLSATSASCCRSLVRTRKSRVSPRLKLIRDIERFARELRRIDSRVCGDSKGEHHAGNRSVHTRLMHEVPERNACQQVWPQLANPHHVEPDQNNKHR